jgi:tetratricopeptide (TPR) repeat protein
VQQILRWLARGIRSASSNGAAENAAEGARHRYAAASDRFISHYLKTAERANRAVKPALRRRQPGPDPRAAERAALDLLDRERPNLLQAVRDAHRAGRWTTVCGLADALSVFLYTRSHWSDWLTIAELGAADAERAADPRLQAQAQNDLSVLYRQLGRLDEAGACAQRAVELWQRLGSRYDEGLAHGNAGGIQVASRTWESARSSYEVASTIFEELHDRTEQAQSLVGLGIVLAEQGDLDGAAAKLEEAIAIQREMDDSLGQAQALNNLGVVRRRQDNLPAMVTAWEASLALKEHLGDRSGTLTTMTNLANALERMDQRRRALGYWERALAIARDVDPAELARIRRRLERTRSALAGSETPD